MSSLHEQQNLPCIEVVPTSSLIFQRVLDAAVTAATFWVPHSFGNEGVPPYILHIQGPISELESEWAHTTQQHISWEISFLLSAYKLCDTESWHKGEDRCLETLQSLC